MRPTVMLLVASLLLLSTAPSAEAADGHLEIDILEAYLAVHDAAPGTPHCARHHGYVLTPAAPPMRLPAGGTNRVLQEHFAFHAEMRDQPGSGFSPSPDDADRYGIVFFEWHRQFLAAYEAWRLANGHPPLEPWDPATPMPPELAYEYPERGCTDGRNSDPQVALPTWATVEGGDEPDPLFGHTHLCAFKDLNQLGKSIAIDYHWQFHARIGGDMTATQGPRDPAFWAGHQFINRLMDRWWEACDGSAGLGPLGQGADAPGARALPAPGAAGVAAALAVGALALARLRGRR